MLPRWGLYLAMLAAPAVGATIRDVSDDASVVVQAGDTLVFQLLTSSFAADAARLRLPVRLTDISFAFATSPLSGAGSFAATLESADGLTSLAFGELTFGAGSLDRGGNGQEVSVLQSSLSQLDSKAFFGEPSVFIAMRNDGPEVTLGVPSFAMRQDMFATLSGGSLQVGAIPTSVELESQDKPGSSIALERAVPFSVDSEAPEPRSGGLLLGGGALLCGLSGVLARVARGRKERYRAKNQPFASANPL
jgi:hypothetical protein